jgi:hypothetical protein
MKFFCHGYVKDNEAARLKRLDGGRDAIGAAAAERLLRHWPRGVSERVADAVLFCGDRDTFIVDIHDYPLQVCPEFWY